MDFVGLAVPLFHEIFNGSLLLYRLLILLAVFRVFKIQKILFIFLDDFSSNYSIFIIDFDLVCYPNYRLSLLDQFLTPILIKFNKFILEDFFLFKLFIAIEIVLDEMSSVLKIINEMTILDISKLLIFENFVSFVHSVAISLSKLGINTK